MTNYKKLNNTTTSTLTKQRARAQHSILYIWLALTLTSSAESSIRSSATAPPEALLCQSSGCQLRAAVVAKQQPDASCHELSKSVIESESTQSVRNTLGGRLVSSVWWK